MEHPTAFCIYLVDADEDREATSAPFGTGPLFAPVTKMGKA